MNACMRWIGLLATISMLALLAPVPAAATGKDEGSAPVVAAVSTEQTLTVVSEPGIPWTEDGSANTGGAVLTYGHSGCIDVTPEGVCTSGAWPALAGAHWIWNAQNVTPDDALDGGPTYVFTKEFDLPADALFTAATLTITADVVYSVSLNGVGVGDGSGWETFDTFALVPIAGHNVLVVTAHGSASGMSNPYFAPNGLIFSLAITYRIAGTPTVTTRWEASITPTSATLYFETDVAAHGYVDFGLTSKFGRVRPVTEQPLATNHTIALTGLKPNTLYFWRARGVNGIGTGVSPLSSFRTPATNATGKLTVSKTNSTGSKLLPGACFGVIQDLGNGRWGDMVSYYCDRFDTTPMDGKLVFPALTPGKYVLYEYRSPDGYQLGKQQLFTIAAGQQLAITFTDSRGGTRLHITAKNEQEKIVTGMCYAVYTRVGDSFGSYVTYSCDHDDGEDGITTLGNLRTGAYFLYQYPPEGYARSDATSFTVVKGEPDKDLNETVTSETAAGNAIISIVDSKGAYYGNACLALYKAAAGGKLGDYVTDSCDGWDGWVDGRIVFTDLGPGALIALEYHPPQGFVTGQRVRFTKAAGELARATLKQTRGGIDLRAKTVRNDTGGTLRGACFGLHPYVNSTTAGEQLAFWCDDYDANDGTTVLGGVRPGTYWLMEYLAPVGYKRVAVKVVVTASDTIKRVTVRNLPGGSAQSTGDVRSGDTPALGDLIVQQAASTATPVETASPTATREAPATATLIPATPEPTIEPTTELTRPPEITPTETPVEQPNGLPVANAGPDQMVIDLDASGDETVMLDGSASADPDAEALSFEWTIDGMEIATGSTATFVAPIGTTTIRLIVTDSRGETATDEVTIVISPAPVPTVAPAPTVEVTPAA